MDKLKVGEKETKGDNVRWRDEEKTDLKVYRGDGSTIQRGNKIVKDKKSMKNQGSPAIPGRESWVRSIHKTGVKLD